MTALHAALDGDGAPSFAFVLSRLCDEFQCTPSAAWHELDTLPAGVIDEILEARYYARAKAAVDAADSAAAYARLPDDALTSLAKLITFERAATRRR